jgi:hypothetical protein
MLGVWDLAGLETREWGFRVIFLGFFGFLSLLYFFFCFGVLFVYSVYALGRLYAFNAISLFTYQKKKKKE